MNRLSLALDERRVGQTFRQRRPVRVLDSTHLEVGGQCLVNFASNNYLGLTHHPRVIAAFQNAAATYGVGSGAAALVTGHTDAHASAERAIAKWKGTESGVLLGSGYAANLAAVQMLAAVGGGDHGGPHRGVRFLVDKLAHASLIDAVRAVGQGTAKFRVFPHNHLGKLRRLLEEAEPNVLQVVVTESIFSMDGDAADLAGIVALKREFPFLLLLDEAHGSGVYGSGGAGHANEIGLAESVDLSIVTLSKAAGCLGGAVCGSRLLCDAVVNFGRPYVFSTAVPPAVAAAVEAAIGVMTDEPHRQRRVRELARRVRSRVSGLQGDSPIIPIILGDESAALAAAEALKQRGILVVAVRPPTVPKGTSRLRVTVSCDHSDEEVSILSEAVLRVVEGSSQG
jgi:8-amino-7-oxononanoate synthase